MKSHNLKPQNDLKYRSFKFSLEIIKLVQVFPNKRAYWLIGDQLLRCSTSIGANIIEAKASSSKRDFIRFFQTALKSVNEAEYWLKLLKESKLINIDKATILLNEANVFF